MFQNSVLATGGLTAALLAGWQQLKTVFGYLSGFVVITAKFDGSSSFEVIRFLNANWRALPNGHSFFIQRWFPYVTGFDRGRHVLFRALAPNGIFVYGLGFLTYDISGDILTLRSLRGAVDFEALAIAASEFNWKATAELRFEDFPQRFRVEKVVGLEKGVAANFRTRQGKAPTELSPAAQDPAGTGSSQQGWVDLLLDESFQFPSRAYSHEQDASDPFAGLYFDDAVMTHVSHAQRWMSMCKWYRARGIPWRRGWLLHGPPGTGKSSLARAVAQKLQIPIYQFNLQTLSDQEFMERWSDMDRPCMALLEDFDTTFKGRKSLTQCLTFDCVLNQISGVDSRDGIFLTITTNDISAIDPAIGVECGRGGLSTRPGRIDTIIEVGGISLVHKRAMASRILVEWPDEIEDVVEAAGDCTPVQFQELCLQRAFAMIARDEVGLVSASKLVSRPPPQKYVGQAAPLADTNVA